VFDQDENFRMAIRQKRARMEEINLILARPVMKGVTAGSIRRLIEERLHLEEAVAELEAEKQRLQFQDANNSFRWEDIDQPLLTSKTFELAREMHKRANDGERRITFEVAQSGNSSGYLPRYFEFHEQLADQWAEKLYAAYCETWKEQNRPLLPAFIRAVRDRAIAELLAARKSCVCGQLEFRAMRINEPLNAHAIGEWMRRMDRLDNRWQRKLEGDAVAAKYGGVKQSFAGSIAGSGADAELGHSSGIAESPSRPIFPEEPRKCGRVSVRPDRFVSVAGTLWLAARQKNGSAKVSESQLREIASNLDKNQFVPPAQYLESDCAMQLKTFNSKNSNSKMGPIMTWSQLVTVADKDHLRGMRRLLSRCAAQARDLSICPMSGN
jgi:hypothetical protein